VSITDELRSWAEGNTLRAGMSLRTARDQALAIADHIDAEYEKVLDERDSERFNALMDAREDGVNAVLKGPEGFGLVKLPRGADDEYIRIGDAVTCGATVWTVTGLKFLGEGWGVCCTVYNECGGSGTSVYPPSNLRHHRAPTVEDVLREFAEKVIDSQIPSVHPTYEEAIAEYAAKLRLAGDAE